MKIVTFNIRCCYAGFDKNQSFIFRAGLIRDAVLREKPDVIAFQEVTPDILSLLKTIMPDYTIYGHGRMADFGSEGVYTAIRNETTELFGLETFWLSPTPNVPESRYEEQSQCPRICCKTLLHDKKSGKNFYVYNIHLDHLTTPAQEKQLRLTVDRMKEKDFDFPAILLGDFNLVDGKSPEIEWLEAQDVFPLKRISKTYPATFHNFGKNPDYGTIDYIYATPDVSESAKKVKLWKDECEGIYLSDHYPVSVEIKL